jgi:MerR family transcriptional regulator, redox-sensitive transcriptional activator SoxR
MAKLADRVTIGEFAQRAGVAASALRYYEELGLISSERSAGGQRRYARVMLRRVAFIRAAQTVGLSLADVRIALARLPEERTPNKADWNKVSATWIRRVDERIAELERLRATLNSCVGCGCLSLQTCRLYNPDDTAATGGPGARWLLGDTPPTQAGSGTER